MGWLEVILIGVGNLSGGIEEEVKEVFDKFEKEKYIEDIWK